MFPDKQSSQYLCGLNVNPEVYNPFIFKDSIRHGFNAICFHLFAHEKKVNFVPSGCVNVIYQTLCVSRSTSEEVILIHWCIL